MQCTKKIVYPEFDGDRPQAVAWALSSCFRIPLITHLSAVWLRASKNVLFSEQALSITELTVKIVWIFAAKWRAGTLIERGAITITTQVV